jgi:hypothetical protein
MNQSTSATAAEMHLGIYNLLSKHFQQQIAAGNNFRRYFYGA